MGQTTGECCRCLSKGYAWLSISPEDPYGKTNKNKNKNSNQKPLYGMIVKLRCDVCVLSGKNTMLILHGPWTFNLV